MESRQRFVVPCQPGWAMARRPDGFGDEYAALETSWPWEPVVAWSIEVVKETDPDFPTDPMHFVDPIMADGDVPAGAVILREPGGRYCIPSEIGYCSLEDLLRHLSECFSESEEA